MNKKIFRYRKTCIVRQRERINVRLTLLQRMGIFGNTVTRRIIRVVKSLIRLTFDFAGIAAAYRPTPATIRVVTALLGDLCTDDKDCTIPNSECSNGGCICSEGYAETSDRQECFGKKSFAKKNLTSLASLSLISYLDIRKFKSSHITVLSYHSSRARPNNFVIRTYPSNVRARSTIFVVPC